MAHPADTERARREGRAHFELHCSFDGADHVSYAQTLDDLSGAFKFLDVLDADLKYRADVEVLRVEPDGTVEPISVAEIRSVMERL